MSYRTYIGTTGKDSIQILGNNEYYKPFIEQLQKYGYEVNDEGIYYAKPIKELQPLIDILEQYILDKRKHIKNIYKKDIFNLKPKDMNNLTFDLMELQENAYIFTTSNIIKYLEDNIDIDYDIERKKYVFKLKEGKEIWFEAF